jgi:phosphoglycerate dehydrogenase-like enzyme
MEKAPEMTRVAVLDDWQGVARSSANWSALTARAEVVFFDQAFRGDDSAAAGLAEFEIILSMRERTPFPASLISQLPRLRMLGITGSHNPSLDVAACTARGVVVCNTVSDGRGASATAELALGLLLAAARGIPTGDAAVRAGRFQTGVPVGLTLAGRTLGVIGLGRLGSLMARYGQALGMSILAWSPNLTAERAAATGAELTSKADLLTRSDAVSLHLVLSPRSRGIIGAGDIALMKPGAILVNTSRGPLVDEAALLAAVHAGRIVAALDVYDREPLPPDHPLRTAPNTVLTPHLGYGVAETWDQFYPQSVENALAFLDGKPIRVVNPEALNAGGARLDASGP